MEKIFSFIAEHISVINIIVLALVGYFVIRLEPFKVRDEQFEKGIDKLWGAVSALTDFVHEKLADSRERCVDCRKEIDNLTDLDRNEITSFHGRFDTLEAMLEGKLALIEERLGKHDQFYYETEAWMTTKAEILSSIDGLRAEIVVVRTRLEELAHRVSLNEVDV
jgi:hypothetical protein